MWISLFAFVIAIAIFLNVAAVMMAVSQSMKSIWALLAISLDRRERVTLTCRNVR